MNELVRRDERELQIDLAADRLAALVMSFGLLLIVGYRAVAFREASWELLGLVVLGGAVGSGYRLFKGTVNRRWVAIMTLTAVIAAVVAVVLGVVIDLR